MNQYVVEIEKVTVRKGNNILLDNISMHVSRGECLCVIGPNGAGKTTLMNVIAGFEKFTGIMRLFGKQASWRRERSQRIRIGYVPQAFYTDPTFPILAREAVMTGVIGRLGLFRSPGKNEREQVMKLMEMMRMKHLADRPLGQLSGGERQKVALARAILQQPDILLMDEPTANLDIAVQKEVVDLVSRIHQQEGLTIFFVTHDFNMIPSSSHRIILLDRGKIIFDGAADRALSGETLGKAFQYPLETFVRNGKRFVSYE